MHIQRHTNTSTHVQWAHKRNGDNQAQEPGWERREKDFNRDLTTTTKKKVRKKLMFTKLKKGFEHIELPAKLLDYFLRSNKSNINQSEWWFLYYWESEDNQRKQNSMQANCSAQTCFLVTATSMTRNLTGGDDDKWLFPFKSSLVPLAR